MMTEIDEVFKDFVQKNYRKLTENQKVLCQKMGIAVPN